MAVSQRSRHLNLPILDFAQLLLRGGGTGRLLLALDTLPFALVKVRTHFKQPRQIVRQHPAHSVPASRRSQNSTIIQWDGATFTPQAAGVVDSFRSIWGSDARHIWVSGCTGRRKWDGTAWTREPLDPAFRDFTARWGNAAHTGRVVYDCYDLRPNAKATRSAEFRAESARRRSRGRKW